MKHKNICFVIYHFLFVYKPLYLTGDLKSLIKNSSHIFCVQMFQV